MRSPAATMPCRAWPSVLDDDRLSELVGNRSASPGSGTSPARPRSLPSAAPATARRTTVGPSPRPATPSCTDGPRSRTRRGGGVQLLRPAPGHTDAIIAVGGIEDDWALRDNLRWLGDPRLERLGAGCRRRRRFLSGSADGTAVQARAAGRSDAADPWLADRHQNRGAARTRDRRPFPPAASSSRGPGASHARRCRLLRSRNQRQPRVGRRGPGGRRRRLGLPAGQGKPSPGSMAFRRTLTPARPPGPKLSWSGRLAATCAMVAALVPALEVPAARWPPGSIAGWKWPRAGGRRTGPRGLLR